MQSRIEGDWEMGKYAAMTYLDALAREDIPDEILVDMIKGDAVVAGYHPTGEPGEVQWHEVTEWEEGMNHYMGEPTIRAGDWRVRIVVPVQEENELPPRSPDD
jgi:hypothetical protein